VAEEKNLTQIGSFEMKPYDSAVDLTDTNRFTKLKMTREQKAHVNALVGAAPTLLGANALSKTYVLTFPEGVQGSLMQLKAGGYTTTIVNPETGRIVGTAALQQTSLQGACLGAFSAMSIATGQYFLTEINSKLNMMKLSIDKILEFLYGDKRAELLSEISFVRFAYQNYSSIMDHEQQRVSTIISLQEARKVAMKDIEFYMADLSSIVTTRDNLDILAVSENAVQIKDCLELSTQLYVISNLMEVAFAQNYDKEYLQSMEDDVSSYIDKCDKRVLTNFSKLQQAIAGYKAGIFKKIDKDILEANAQQIEEIVEQLNTVDTSPMKELLHSSLEASEKKVDYYINNDGDVFLKAS
jgi:uncharacterized protein related to proFAR isomerase